MPRPSQRKSRWTSILAWLTRVLAPTQPDRLLLETSVPVTKAPQSTKAEAAEARTSAPTSPPLIRRGSEFDALTDPRRRRISTSFNSTQPVENRRDLYGRSDKLDALFDAVVTREQHALIYGARGSGKTSLVRVFADYADQQGLVVLYTACEPQQGFAALLTLYLQTIPRSHIAHGRTLEFRERLEKLGDGIRPREAVDFLAEFTVGRLIFIFDEFDRIDNRDVRLEFASFLKLLTDTRLQVQAVLVGIGSDLTELITDHPSLRRHLTAIPIGRINAAAVREMIDIGAAQAGLPFEEANKALIASLTCGSPYHVRLFCAHAGLQALRNGHESVTSADAIGGVVAAIEDWALMNEQDADIFRRLSASNSAAHHALAHVARSAAILDAVNMQTLRMDLPNGQAEEAVRLFGLALIRQGHDQYVFRDSVAPQFFLAMLLTQTARMEDVPDNVIPLSETARLGQAF